MAEQTQQPERIELDGIETRDITRGAIDSLHFTQEELRAFLASNGGKEQSFSDIESTGLNARSSGVTQFSSAKAVESMSGGDAKMELLDVYMLPTRPIFHEYENAKKWAEQHGEPAPDYNRRLYEYDVDEAALRVTGTKYSRDRDDGPISGMQIEVKDEAGAVTKVKTITDPCPSFYAAIPEIEAFIIKDHDLYYNAPFDKPFLKEKWFDALAYDAYLQANPDERQRAEALLKNPEAVVREIAECRKTLVNNLEIQQSLAFLGDSNQWQCLLHGYMAARPSQPSNTLDTSYTDLVDPAFEGRKEHDAAEDIAMSAKVAAKLMEPEYFDGDIPNFAQLYERLLREHIPEVTVETVPYDMPYYADNQVKDRLDSSYGHLRITIPLDEAGELDDIPAALHDFFADFDEAYLRNSGSPQHIVEMHEVNGAVEILVNTNRSKPLSINLLKKLLFFEDAMQMKRRIETEDPELHIARLNWFDSTAKVDVQLEEGDKFIEDVPLRSLQINLKFLRDHCTDAAERGEYLELIKQVTSRKSASQLYLNHDEESQQTHLQIKGNLRGGGVIDIAIPKDAHPLDYSFDVMQQLDKLLRMGALFGVESSERAFEEEEDESYKIRGRKEQEAIIAGTSVALEGRKVGEGETLSPPSFRLALSPALGQMVWNLYRRDNPQNFSDITIGEDAKLTRDEKGQVHFEGELDEAFARHPLDVEKDGNAKETAEFSRTLADCSWLAYRLQEIPGVSELSIHADHTGSLHLPNGISTKALMVLHAAKVPFSIAPANGDAPTHITLDMNALMVDAFEYSRDLSRATKEVKAFFSGDSEKLRTLNEESRNRFHRYERDVTRIAAALHAGDIAALEVNIKGEMRFSTKRDMADAAEHGAPPLRHKFPRLGDDPYGTQKGLEIVTNEGCLRVDESTINAPMDVPLNIKIDAQNHQAIATLRSPMAEWMDAMADSVGNVAVEDKSGTHSDTKTLTFTLNIQNESHNALLTKLSALAECYYYFSMIHGQPRFSFTKQKQITREGDTKIRAIETGEGDVPTLILSPYSANLSSKAAALYAKMDAIRAQFDQQKEPLNEAVSKMHALLLPDEKSEYEAFSLPLRRSLSADKLGALFSMPMEQRFDVMDRLSHGCDDVREVLKDYRYLCISFTDEIEKLRAELSELSEASKTEDIAAALGALNMMHDEVYRAHNAMERMEDAASALKNQCYDKQRTQGFARKLIDLELAHLPETVAQRVDKVVISDPKDEDAAIKESLQAWRGVMIEKIKHAATDADCKIKGKGAKQRRETDEEREERRTKKAEDILNKTVLKAVVGLLSHGESDEIVQHYAFNNSEIVLELLQHLLPDLPLNKHQAQSLIALCSPESNDEEKSQAESLLLESIHGKKEIRLIEDLISASMIASGAASEAQLVARYEQEEIESLPASKSVDDELPKIHKRIKSAMKRVRELMPDPHAELKASRALLGTIGNDDDGVIKELNDFERTMLHGERHMNRALAMLYAEPSVLEIAQGGGERSAIQHHQQAWQHAYAASDALLAEGKRTAQKNLQILGLTAANDNLPDSFTIDMQPIIDDPQKWAEKLRGILVAPQRIEIAEEPSLAPDGQDEPPHTGASPIEALPFTPEIEEVEHGIRETLDLLKANPEMADATGIRLSIPLHVPAEHREVYHTSILQLINETTPSLQPEWEGLTRCEVNDKGELVLHVSPAIAPRLLQGLLHHNTALEHLATPRAQQPDEPDASDLSLNGSQAEILAFPSDHVIDEPVAPSANIAESEYEGMALSEKMDLPLHK